MGLSPDPVARQNQLANLRMWPNGQSGNPKGRPSVGVSYESWMNELDIHDEQGVAKYDDEALEAIIADKSLCRAKRSAAVELLDMPRRDFHKAIPLRANAVDRACDRTKGKPHQSVHVTKTTIREPAAIDADVASAMAGFITADPSLLAAAMVNVAPDARAKAIAMLPVPPVDEA